jgi:hypothetical protein
MGISQGRSLPQLDLVLPSFLFVEERRRTRVCPVSYNSTICVWREPLMYHDVAKSERPWVLRLYVLVVALRACPSVFFSAEAGCPRPIICCRLSLRCLVQSRLMESRERI